MIQESGQVDHLAAQRAEAARAGGGVTRRSFVRTSAVVGASVLGAGILGSLVTACRSPNDPTAHTTIDVGTETGILNLAYAMLQLEADFYARVAASFYPGVTAAELNALSQFARDTSSARDDMRTNQIPVGRITEGLLYRTGGLVDFASRTSVLTNAQTIEVTVANAMATMAGLVTTSDKQTLLSDLTTQSQARASTIDGWLDTTFTPSTVTLSAAMTVLTPYYLTTVSLSNA